MNLILKKIDIYDQFRQILERDLTANLLAGVTEIKNPDKEERKTNNNKKTVNGYIDPDNRSIRSEAISYLHI